MKPATHSRMVEAIRALHFVEWDRGVPATVGDDTQVTAYGWVARKDGKRDFVLLETWDSWHGVSFTTSSAKWSKEISRVLYGSAVEGETHNDCVRVKELFPELVGDQGCPYCHAPAGTFCTTPGGRARDDHRSRVYG